MPQLIKKGTRGDTDLPISKPRLQTLENITYVNTPVDKGFFLQTQKTCAGYRKPNIVVGLLFQEGFGAEIICMR